jgi:hypothetical protein
MTAKTSNTDLVSIEPLTYCSISYSLQKSIRRSLESKRSPSYT